MVPRYITISLSHKQKMLFNAFLISQSCPAIQVYSAKNLERGLTQAAKNFCTQEVEVEESLRKVRLSKIFEWYGSDFADNKRKLLE